MSLYTSLISRLDKLKTLAKERAFELLAFFFFFLLETCWCHCTRGIQVVLLAQSALV